MFAMVSMLVALMIATPVLADTVATGPAEGFYHNALFNMFKASANRASQGQMKLTKVNEQGTDGTIANLEMVNSGKAQIAFVQLDGIAIEQYSNVKVIGTFGYEAFHFVVPKNSKIGSCDVLEEKTNFKIGLNSMGGSKVTTKAMTIVDKDYGKVSYIDTIDALDAEMKMKNGEIDGYIFVSTPGSGTAQTFAGGQYQMMDCWDGDFDDYKLNGVQLYEKVKMKKAYGYTSNFTTFSVPGVVVVNAEYAAANRNNLRILMNATKMTFDEIKAQKKFTFYPGD